MLVVQKKIQKSGESQHQGVYLLWLDGWMVGWLDGWMVGYLFFFTLRSQPDHIPELREEKPRSARNQNLLHFHYQEKEED